MQESHALCRHAPDVQHLLVYSLYNQRLSCGQHTQMSCSGFDHVPCTPAGELRAWGFQDRHAADMHHVAVHSKRDVGCHLAHLLGMLCFYHDFAGWQELSMSDLLWNAPDM